MISQSGMPVRCTTFIVVDIDQAPRLETIADGEVYLP
ncbi:hypothetical protein J2T60_000558 [Natronospira proteinivora]|uniref:Uncharacterized protein n=1 Tax=Natronospira proteinivora TaxID=1807133 RepID=A0ABT1G8F8_9GAMM|nr:hypothetical protein [Natronospira proteinivora]